MDISIKRIKIHANLKRLMFAAFTTAASTLDLTNYAAHNTTILEACVSKRGLLTFSVQNTRIFTGLKPKLVT